MQIWDTCSEKSSRQIIDCLVQKCSVFHLNWRRVVIFPNFYQKVPFLYSSKYEQNTRSQGSALYDPEDLQVPPPHLYTIYVRAELSKWCWKKEMEHLKIHIIIEPSACITSRALVATMLCSRGGEEVTLNRISASASRSSCLLRKYSSRCTMRP